MPPAQPHQPSNGTPAPRHEERLEYRFALAFGFMSVIPILIVWAWAKVHAADMSLALYGIVGSALIGYFFITRRIVRSMIVVAQKVRAITSGQAAGRIDVAEPNEIGELARSFNRITQELEHKIEELESSRELARKLLSRIGTAINSYEGIDNLLSLIIENSAAALGAEMGTLMLVDGEKQELYVKTMWSNNGQVVDPQLRIRLGDGIAGSVARQNHPTRAIAQPAALGFSKTGAEESAILSVPLQLRDHPIGVLTVLRKGAARPFTEDDEALLGSIGSQVAVAIENYRLNLDVERTYLETIMALALAVEAKDPYSAGHSKRVGFYATQIAEEMGLGEEILRTLNDAGILHDIGKIGIKDEILLKPGALTPDEQKIMQQHPVIGEAIVKPVRSLGKVVALVRHHHERYDGMGYPAGLKGEAIPLGARILAVADTYDAMVTDRPYRKRLSVEETKREFKKGAGSQHDPAVVDALLRVLERKELRLTAAKDAAAVPPMPPASPSGAVPAKGSDPETLGCR
ncbi:MAG: HD domain-containing protein [Candidatus Omnitrophica bacterium]|nr:HD domain-containing protein [Candidatus Omnitrophota bacterium]